MDISRIAMAALGAVSVASLAYAVFYPYWMGDARAEKRKKALEQSAGKSSRVVVSVNRREQVAQSLKEVEQRQKALNRLTLDDLIAQAGLDWSRRNFYVVSIIAGVGVAVGLFLIAGPLVAFMGLFIGCFGLPRWVLSYLRRRRMNKFLIQFPNAIDVIVRGVRSGLPINDCLRGIASDAAEPVRGEFRRIAEALAVGVSAGDACTRLYERIPIPETNFFGIVIQVQQKAGGSLSEVLSNLSRVLRDRRKMKGKIDAMSMEAKASAAIIGSLPFLVTFLLWFFSPEYIELLWKTQYGKIGLVAGAMMMTTGILIMKKMINFDI
jgi:tight adherence protein B